MFHKKWQNLVNFLEGKVAYKLNNKIGMRIERQKAIDNKVQMYLNVCLKYSILVKDKLSSMEPNLI